MTPSDPTADRPGKPKVSGSVRILIGAVSGILCGLFFGDGAHVLQPIGTVYVALLQMAVFPFLVSSLLHGLGSMNPATAWKLFRAGWPVFLLAWTVTLAALALVVLALPAAPPPLVLTAESGGGLAQWVSLLVPANPVSDLTKNYVPAVVVFCVIYGVAIQANPQKDGLLRGLEVIKKATITIWGWVVKMAPLGVFALFADLAGTVRFELLGSLFVYLLLYFGAALVLAFWVLPALLTSFLPVPRREVLGDLRASLLIAVATSLPITAVPGIVQWAEQVITRLAGREKDDDAVISTTVAVGYPLAQLGNLFVFLFMAFAAVFFHAALEGAEWFALPVLTILSTAGTPVSTVDAVAFLSQWLRLPADAQLLYVETMTLTRYPQVLVSALGIAFVTVLVPAVYYGIARVRRAQLALALGTGLLLLGGLAVGGRALTQSVSAKKSDPYRNFTLGSDLTSAVRATVFREPVTEALPAGTVMDRVRATGRLRVGYAPHLIPFSYFNARGELVGYDIAFAYALARDLNVNLELVPFQDWSRLDEDLNAGRFDLAVGGIFLTAERLQQTTASKAYRQSPLALIVRTSEADKFLDGQALREDRSLRVAAFTSEILVPLARTLFPQGDVQVVPNYDALLDDPSLDAALWTLDQARAWAASHPGFTAVVPSDFGAPFLMAYLMPPDSREFAVLVDQWLDLQRANGFQQDMESYWVDGKLRLDQGPRWSILRNVLGWGK